MKSSELLRKVLVDHRMIESERLFLALQGKPSRLTMELPAAINTGLPPPWATYIQEAQRALDIYPLLRIESPSSRNWNLQVSAVLYIAIDLAEAVGD